MFQLQMKAMGYSSSMEAESCAFLLVSGAFFQVCIVIIYFFLLGRRR